MDKEIAGRAFKLWTISHLGEFFFDNYERSKITEKEKFEPILRKSINGKRGLFFMGGVGAGKTMLLLRVLELFIETNDRHPSEYISFYHEQELVNILKKKVPINTSRVMMIDDFGSTVIPPWLVSDYEYMFTKIHARGTVLYVTSNMELDRIAKQYKRSCSRIKEITDGYTLPDVDRRKKPKEKRCN